MALWKKTIARGAQVPEHQLFPNFACVISRATKSRNVLLYSLLPATRLMP